MKPRAEDYDFDLAQALDAVVELKALIPPDALTAEVLGTERVGHGVLIERGIVLTIGYLVTEAETVWLTLADGQTVPGHAMGYDQETGFGLVQALGRIDAEPLELGDSSAVPVGEDVVVAGGGGIDAAVAARLISRQEFAGYWEYVLDDALFTAPAHPHWGGAAVIGPDGRLIGIGSLQVQQAEVNGEPQDINMVVPINLLKPILEDLKTIGRPRHAPRPWLGLYATEIDGEVVVVGMSSRGPAEAADVRAGDIVIGVGEEEIDDLADFFRAVWACGEAGTEVPLLVYRDGRMVRIPIRSVDRRALLKGPVLH